MAEFYTTGTVSVTSGGTAVTGVGTFWSPYILAADTLELAGQRVTIASVGGNTALTLSAPWTGADQSGASYTIRFDAPSRFTSAYLATQVRALRDKAAIIEAARPNYGVQSLGSDTPPGSPVTGDTYVVGTTPTGAWTGQANNLAQWTGSEWLFTAPEAGASVVSDATGVLSIWNGTTWLPYVAPSAFMHTLLDDTDAAAARATLGGTAFRALGTLTAAAGSFARYSGTGASDAAMQAMVGPVSQAAGVPTGAIVERGSNGNGDWVKYADGTQMCWRTTAATLLATTSAASGLYRTDLYPVSFPAAFAAVPVGFMNVGAGNGWMGSIGGMSTTAWSYQLLSLVDHPTPVATTGMYFFAVGRWF